MTFRCRVCGGRGHYFEWRGRVECHPCKGDGRLGLIGRLRQAILLWWLAH